MVYEQENLHNFGLDFQTKCIAAMLTDKVFLEQILEILHPKFFEREADAWIVSLIKKYFLEYKSAPTLTVFKVEISELSNEVLKSSIVSQLKEVFQKLDAEDMKYIKETFVDFAQKQNMALTIIKASEMVVRKEYDGIPSMVSEALKAGMKKELGHDYFADIDKRMSEMARKCVRTGWDLVDDLMDGGLGEGELGFVVAPAGSGKCVGPNTKIEIQYEEIGIPFKNNLGEENIFWVNPFDKYDIGNGLGKMYGWQIRKILEK